MPTSNQITTMLNTLQSTIEGQEGIKMYQYFIDTPTAYNTFWSHFFTGSFIKDIKRYATWLYEDYEVEFGCF